MSAVKAVKKTISFEIEISSEEYPALRGVLENTFEADTFHKINDRGCVVQEYEKQLARKLYDQLKEVRYK